MGIKKPDIAYEHPNKIKKTSKSSSLRNVEPPALPKNENLTAKSSETMHVRIVAHYPAEGVSEAFDQMCAADIDPKTAMLALLKRGIGSFEMSCANGNIDKIQIQGPLKPKFIETTRALSRSAFEIAKKHFDPFDVLSRRALGVKIGDAIFAVTIDN